MLEIFFNIFGGLALFLYGIYLLSGGFKKAAGPKLKNVLRKLTSNSFRGVGLGAFITLIVQSSSIVVVTLIGLLNAGLLTLKQSIGVVLGAELGTTITAQLIAFKVGAYFLPIIILGFIFYFFAKKKSLVYFGQILLGFGILFLGMNLMGQGVRPLGESPFFENMLFSFAEFPLLGILAGALFTAVIQSSSAAIGFVIVMGMEGIIALPAAVALILGANIGTCITGFLASLKSSLNAKRLSAAHFLNNILGVVVFFPFLAYFSRLVELTSNDLARQIANAHTLFNLAVVLALFPFIVFMENLVKKILPGRAVEIERGPKFLNEQILNTPSLAILQAQKELIRMAKLTRDMLEEAQKLIFNGDACLKKSIEEKEYCVDELHRLIDNYLMRISVLDMSEKDSQKLALLMHSVTDIERVADHAHNLAKISDFKKKKKIKFSEQAKKELNYMFDKARRSFERSISALWKEDPELARQVLGLEKEVNKLDSQLRIRHDQRLKRGACSPQAGPVYLDIVHNLERVSDHSENIALGFLTGF